MLAVEGLTAYGLRIQPPVPRCYLLLLSSHVVGVIYVLNILLMKVVYWHSRRLANTVFCMDHTLALTINFTHFSSLRVNSSVGSLR